MENITFSPERACVPTIHFAYVLLSIGIAEKWKNNSKKEENGSNGSGLHFLNSGDHKGFVVNLPFLCIKLAESC